MHECNSKHFSAHAENHRSEKRVLAILFLFFANAADYFKRREYNIQFVDLEFLSLGFISLARIKSKMSNSMNQTVKFNVLIF